MAGRKSINPPRKRGRPPKPRALETHVEWIPRHGGGIQLVTLPGPWPSKRGRRPKPKSTVEKWMLDRKRQLLVRMDAAIRKMRTVERDEQLCIAVAERIRTGLTADAAIEAVGIEHEMGYDSVLKAYYTYRHLLEWVPD